jgi:3-oxoacyl-[acyl-carrier-protein] synthase III
MVKDTVGIAGIGSYLPEKVVDAWEAIEGSGMNRKKFDRIGCIRLHQAAEGEQPSDMSVTASKLALADAEMDPSDIDCIIYTGSVKDHTRWQAAAKIQFELGCKNAYVFDIYQGCNGQNMAMNIGHSIIRSDPNVDTVLITSGERFDSTLEPPVLGKTYLFGDGGSSGILKRNHPDYVILSTAYKTWGIHHGNFCVPEVGAFSKLSMEVVERGGHQLQVYAPLCTTREQLQEFGERLLEIADELIDKACKKASVVRSDIDFVATVNGSKRHNQVFLENMRLADKKSNLMYIEETAHMGSTDTFYNLDYARTVGDVKKGDLILFYTGGAGYTWAITMVRF